MSGPHAIRPSRRTDRLGFSDIVKIRNEVLALTASGRKVIRLEGGEPFPPTPSFVRDAMKRALDEGQTRYAPSSGIPALLEAICAKLAARNGVTADPSGVIVVNGGAHGLFCAFQATLDEGDEALFFSPYWTPIRDLVTFAGAEPVLVPWEEGLGGDLAGAIERRLTPRTRAIYVNTPSNPGGHVWNLEQMETIASIARERALTVIADEAYEDLLYDERHVSMASLPGMAERTVSIWTLSKSFSMTGCRIGYVAAPPPIMDVLRKLVLNSTNGVSTPTQYGALAALRDGSSYLDEMRQQYRVRRDMLVEAALRAGFRCTPPRGAFYLFADVSERLGGDSWAAMRSLLDRASISTVPGAVFGPHGEGHLRMSFSNPAEVLEEAAAALAAL